MVEENDKTYLSRVSALEILPDKDFDGKTDRVDLLFEGTFLGTVDFSLGTARAFLFFSISFFPHSKVCL